MHVPSNFYACHGKKNNVNLEIKFFMLKREISKGIYNTRIVLSLLDRKKLLIIDFSAMHNGKIEFKYKNGTRIKTNPMFITFLINTESTVC